MTDRDVTLPAVSNRIAAEIAWLGRRRPRIGTPRAIPSLAEDHRVVVLREVALVKDPRSMMVLQITEKPVPASQVEVFDLTPQFFLRNTERVERVSLWDLLPWSHAPRETAVLHPDAELARRGGPRPPRISEERSSNEFVELVAQRRQVVIVSPWTEAGLTKPDPVT